MPRQFRADETFLEAKFIIQNKLNSESGKWKRLKPLYSFDLHLDNFCKIKQNEHLQREDLLKRISHKIFWIESLRKKEKIRKIEKSGKIVKNVLILQICVPRQAIKILFFVYLLLFPIALLVSFFLNFPNFRFYLFNNYSAIRFFLFFFWLRLFYRLLQIIFQGEVGIKHSRLESFLGLTWGKTSC